MQLSERIYKLKGKLQHYAWGGYRYIPALLGFTNTENKPYAEYWIGAHPSASADLIVDNQAVSLFDLISSNPAQMITDKTFKQFGELPYLLKVLDVRDMLSIQVHPSRAEAIKGFEAEEAAGIPMHAPNRNYKDKNHKPEIMIALGEFWLLHGFKPLAQLESQLQEVLEFNILKPLFKREGYKGLYQFVMEMDQSHIDTMLTPLVRHELRRKENHELTKSMPGWWVSKLFEGKSEIKEIDRGIFSIYFLNIVKVEKGEAVFQAAGVPHAYLEGQNIELMANSDNVLRGGLTPKHIDVPELMKHVLFSGIVPNVMKGKSIGATEKNYPCPVPDFGINKIELNGNVYGSFATSCEIFILIEGGAIVNAGNTNLVIKKGESFVILPGQEYTIASSGIALLFKAFVPVMDK